MEAKVKVKKGYKRCSTCGNIYKATTKKFYKNLSHQDGLSNNCKVCQKNYVIENYLNNSNYYNKYSSLRNKYNTDKISYNIFVKNVSELKSRYGIGSNSRSLV